MLGMRNLDLRGKLALVTGAASGIGLETSVALAAAGADLVICDVNEAGLQAASERIRAHGRDVLARKVDVSKREQVKALADEVHAKHEALDVLVNNAGVGLAGGFLDTSLEDWEWILGINLWGVIYGCHYFVPKMVARRRGHVVNVASAAGYTASELLVAYSTSKFGVLGFSENLRVDLKKHGIGVSAICPGIINTPITRNSRMRGASAKPGAQERVIKMYEKRNYGPEKVAQGILAAIANDTAVAPISPEAWGMYFFKRFTPGLYEWISMSMAKRMQPT
jgi:NAD(P)-dependent dehydrogenase (short-subunit alcohol dehydrogenase family)